MGWRGPRGMPRPKATPYTRRWERELASLSDLANSITSSIKGVIIDIINFLTPIVDAVAIGMVITGVLLIALRQEFYGIRLIIGGGVALIIVHLVIPLLLGLIPP
jgi:hypothetical protein